MPKKKITSRERAVQFFYKHAGFSYDPKKETKRQGKMRCARNLARAEAEAAARGWTCNWEREVDPDTSWCEDCENGAHNKYEHRNEMEAAILYSEEGDVLASLGNIDRPDRNYRRVVEAELASEALAEGRGG